MLWIDPDFHPWCVDTAMLAQHLTHLTSHILCSFLRWSLLTLGQVTASAVSLSTCYFFALAVLRWDVFRVLQVSLNVPSSERYKYTDIASLLLSWADFLFCRELYVSSANHTSMNVNYMRGGSSCSHKSFLSTEEWLQGLMNCFWKEQFISHHKSKRNISNACFIGEHMKC